MNTTKLIPCTKDTLNTIKSHIVDKTLYDIILQIEQDTNTILIADKAVDVKEGTYLFNNDFPVNVNIIKNIVFTDVVLGFNNHLQCKAGFSQKTLKLGLKIESLFKGYKNYKPRSYDVDTVANVINYCVQRLLSINKIDFSIENLFNIPVLTLQDAGVLRTKAVVNAGNLISWGNFLPLNYFSSRILDVQDDCRGVFEFSTLYTEGATNMNMSDKTVKDIIEYNNATPIVYSRLMTASYYVNVGKVEIVNKDINEELITIDKFQNSNITDDAYEFCNNIEKNVVALNTTLKNLSALKNSILITSKLMNRVNIVNAIPDDKKELKEYLSDKLDLISIAKNKKEINEIISEVFIENNYLKNIKKQYALVEKEKKLKKQFEANASNQILHSYRASAINARSYLSNTRNYSNIPIFMHSAAINIIENYMNNVTTNHQEVLNYAELVAEAIVDISNDENSISGDNNLLNSSIFQQISRVIDYINNVDITLTTNNIRIPTPIVEVGLNDNGDIGTVSQADFDVDNSNTASLTNSMRNQAEETWQEVRNGVITSGIASSLLAGDLELQARISQWQQEVEMLRTNNLLEHE